VRIPITVEGHRQRGLCAAHGFTGPLLRAGCSARSTAHRPGSRCPGARHAGQPRRTRDIGGRIATLSCLMAPHCCSRPRAGPHHYSAHHWRASLEQAPRVLVDATGFDGGDLAGALQEQGAAPVFGKTSAARRRRLIFRCPMLGDADHDGARQLWARRAAGSYWGAARLRGFRSPGRGAGNDAALAWRSTTYKASWHPAATAALAR